MTLTDFENVDSSIVNFNFEIQRDNFRQWNPRAKKTSKEFTHTHTHCKKLYKIRAVVSVHPNLFNEETEDSVKVKLDLFVENNKLNANYYNEVTCALSVIDIEGNSRLPETFKFSPSDDKEMFYLNRPYILKNADEFLTNDVLTIRCDLCFDLNEVDFSLAEIKTEADLWRFLNKIPQTYSSNSGCGAVFDLTFLVLTLPKFHESRKRFGVYGIPPTSPSPNFFSKLIIQKYMDQVWIFDTDDARFLLNSKRKPRRLWKELLEASPVIKRHVNSILTEKKKKLISLPNVNARTFLCVLLYFEQEKFSFYKLEDYFNIEKMSRSYEMEEMRKECKDAIHSYKDHWKSVEEEPEVFDSCSNKYLLNVWDSRRQDFELLMRFLTSIPQTRCNKNKAQIEIPNDLAKDDFCESFTVYDFSSEVLVLPQFHESRKRFGVYGIPPSFSSTCSDTNENNLEFVWMFDTCPDRFILSLDERHDSIGSRLLKMSSVIKLCTITPAKKRDEKLIDFSHLSSWIFLNVLYFVENGVLRCSEFRDFLDIYKMAHLYEMKELQNMCAEEMVKSLLFQTEFDEVESVIDLYRDENLKTLFGSRRRDCKSSYFHYLSCSPTVYLSDKKVASQIDFRNCVSSAGLNKNFTVYDFTYQELDEKIKTDGFIDLSLLSTPFRTEPKEIDLEDVWFFDTCPDRFIFPKSLLCQYIDHFHSKIYMLVEEFENLFIHRSRYILEPSLLISNTSSRTFNNLLFYFKTYSFSSFDFRDLSDLYKMAYFYGCFILQAEIAVEMEKRCKSLSDFKTNGRFSDICLGEGFRMLLESPQDFSERSSIPQSKTDDRTCFECYI